MEPLAPSNLEPLNDQLPDADLFEVDVIFPDYVDIITYLKTNQALGEYNAKQVAALLRKNALFTLIGETLYKQGHDGLLRWYINPSEVPLIFEGYHSNACGGHFAGESTAHKALLVGYWWPTLFKDAHNYTRKCDPCQRVEKPTPTTAMPLVPLLVLAPFEKWRIDFVGPIALATRYGRKCYILVATDYATKWAEVATTRTDDAKTVAKFLYEI